MARKTLQEFRQEIEALRRFQSDPRAQPLINLIVKLAVASQDLTRPEFEQEALYKLALRLDEERETFHARGRDSNNR